MEPSAPAAVSPMPDHPCAGHPGVAAEALCAGCGRWACEACAMPAGRGSLCPACAAARIPWEERRRLGLARAYALTLQPSLFSPDRFFRRLRGPGPVSSALGYAFVTHLVGLSTLAAIVAATPVGIGLPVGFGERVLAAIQILAFVGLLLVGFDVLLALLVHGVLRLLDGGEGGLAATTRAVCYGRGPGILWATIVLPSLFVPQVWSAICTIQAIQKAHRTRPGVAATAVLVPTLACFMGFWILAAHLMPGLLAAAKA